LNDQKQLTRRFEEQVRGDQYGHRKNPDDEKELYKHQDLPSLVFVFEQLGKLRSVPEYGAISKLYHNTA
jgi:hypothetical protein